jgi:hypothetical protein
MPYRLGAQYLIEIYVLEGEHFMFQSDMDMDMLHVPDIVSFYNP